MVSARACVSGAEPINFENWEGGQVRLKTFALHHLDASNAELKRDIFQRLDPAPAARRRDILQYWMNQVRFQIKSHHHPVTTSPARQRSGRKAGVLALSLL